MSQIPEKPMNQSDDVLQQMGASKIGRVMTMSEPDGQKNFLPRGSAQSRYEPPSYYYDASDSGVLPRWAVDEACRREANAP